MSPVEIWASILAILTMPYLMLLTARAIHQDDSIQVGARGWLAAGAVLFSGMVIPAYWIRRLAQRRARGRTPRGLAP